MRFEPWLCCPLCGVGELIIIKTLEFLSDIFSCYKNDDAIFAIKFPLGNFFSCDTVCKGLHCVLIGRAWGAVWPCFPKRYPCNYVPSLNEKIKCSEREGSKFTIITSLSLSLIVNLITPSIIYSCSSTALTPTNTKVWASFGILKLRTDCFSVTNCFTPVLHLPLYLFPSLPLPWCVLFSLCVWSSQYSWSNWTLSSLLSILRKHYSVSFRCMWRIWINMSI